MNKDVKDGGIEGRKEGRKERNMGEKKGTIEERTKGWRKERRKEGSRGEKVGCKILIAEYRREREREREKSKKAIRYTIGKNGMKNSSVYQLQASSSVSQNFMQSKHFITTRVFSFSSQHDT